MTDVTKDDPEFAAHQESAKAYIDELFFDFETNLKGDAWNSVNTQAKKSVVYTDARMDTTRVAEINETSIAYVNDLFADLG